MHQIALRCLVALNGCRVVRRVTLVQGQTSPVSSPGRIVVSGLRQAPGAVMESWCGCFALLWLCL